MKFPEWLNKLLDEDAEDMARVRERWNTEGANTKILILIAYAWAIIDTIRAKSGQDKKWTGITWSVIVGVLMGGATMAIQLARYWVDGPLTVSAKDIIFAFVLVACVSFVYLLGIEVQKRDTRIVIAQYAKAISEISQDVKALRRAAVEGEMAGLATRTREALDERKQLVENERALMDEREKLYKKLGMKNARGAGRNPKYEKWARRIEEVGKEKAYQEFLKEEGLEHNEEERRRFNQGLSYWKKKKN